MKVILASAAALAMSTSLVLAQSAAPEGGAARSTPTCQQALPQIENLIGQADNAGLQTDTAKSHLEEARQAKTAGQEQQCLESLVMAQNDVLEKANSQRAPAPTPN
tara:strand:- start:12157 stop:12474 length:318 start_codon:yes stop_codon:yes gene_type:complete